MASIRQRVYYSLTPKPILGLLGPFRYELQVSSAAFRTYIKSLRRIVSKYTNTDHTIQYTDPIVSIGVVTTCQVRLKIEVTSFTTFSLEGREQLGKSYYASYVGP